MGLQSFFLRLEPFAKSRLIFWISDVFDPLTDHAALTRLTQSVIDRRFTINADKGGRRARKFRQAHFCAGT